MYLHYQNEPVNVLPSPKIVDSDHDPLLNFFSPRSVIKILKPRKPPVAQANQDLDFCVVVFCVMTLFLQAHVNIVKYTNIHIHES